MPLQARPFDIDAMPCPMLRLDARGVVVRANPAFAQLVGRPAHGVLGARFAALLAPAARIYHQLVLEPALTLRGHVEEAALVLLHEDGRERHVLLNAARLHEGELAWTDLVLMPLQLRAGLEQHLLQVQHAAEVMPGVIFRARLEPGERLAVTDLSKPSGELAGIDLAAVLRDSSALFAALPPTQRRRLRAAVRRSARSGAARPFTLRTDTPQGARWLRVHAVVETTPAGRPLWHGSVHDVTQERELDDRLRELDKLHAVSTLAAGVAHDFNNLLGSIVGLTELCQLDAAPASRQAANLERVHAAADRAALLVRQLLDFARQVPPQAVVVRVEELFARAAPLLSAGAPCGIDFDLECARGVRARLDPSQVEQCLLNLVGNAVYALRGRPGGVRVLAALEPCEPPLLRLTVQDDGPGIPAELQKKVFDPFFTTKPVGEGTGLGLDISWRIVVNKHHGSLQVDSVPGDTRFQVLLPLTAADPDPESETVQETA